MVRHIPVLGVGAADMAPVIRFHIVVALRSVSIRDILLTVTTPIFIRAVMWRAYVNVPA
jgi:hypothetical protein